MSDLTPEEGTEWLAAIKAADANCWRGHPQMLREAEQHRRTLLAYIDQLERDLAKADRSIAALEEINATLRNAHEPKEQQQPRLTVDGMDSTEALQVADSHDRAGYLSDWQKALIVLAANYRSLVKRFEHACKEVTRLSNPHETREPQWCECADTPERYRNVCVKCGKAPMPTLIDYNAPSETKPAEPSDRQSAREDLAYFNGAKQALVIAAQDFKAAEKWLEDVGGRSKKEARVALYSSHETEALQSPRSLIEEALPVMEARAERHHRKSIKQKSDFWAKSHSDRSEESDNWIKRAKEYLGVAS